MRSCVRERLSQRVLCLPCLKLCSCLWALPLVWSCLSLCFNRCGVHPCHVQSGVGVPWQYSLQFLPLPFTHKRGVYSLRGNLLRKGKSSSFGRQNSQAIAGPARLNKGATRTAGKDGPNNERGGFTVGKIKTLNDVGATQRSHIGSDIMQCTWRKNR